MTQDELAAIAKRVEKAQATVTALCNREIEWRMSVPARPGSDPDLVISDSLKDIPALIIEVKELRAELRARPPVPRGTTYWIVEREEVSIVDHGPERPALDELQRLAQEHCSDIFVIAGVELELTAEYQKE